MLAQSVATAAYIVAALLFILALAGLSKQETARRGVVYGIAGMTIALVATSCSSSRTAPSCPRGRRRLGSALVAAVVIGGAIGLWRARVVEMTGMPELIALLHSFVGLAAVLVGWNGHLYAEASRPSSSASTTPRCSSASSSAP
jgi:NAD(P) transhydrogenase subunit beta